MFKRIALPVLALLLSVNASELKNQKAAQQAKFEAKIAKIHGDVEKIAQT